MHRSLSLVAILSFSVGCAAARPMAHHSVALQGATSATCRAIGPARTLGSGWSSTDLDAIGGEHEVALAYFQMPHWANAIAVDPWELSVTRTTRALIAAPPVRVVPHVDDRGVLSVETAPRSTVAAASNAAVSVVAWADGETGRIAWSVRQRDGRESTESLAPTSVDVHLEAPSLAALPDGRFALAFVHRCSRERAAMLLTLDAEGRALGEPTPLAPDVDAVGARLVVARDGRGAVAFFDGQGRLAAVPVACGVKPESPTRTVAPDPSASSVDVDHGR